MPAPAVIAGWICAALSGALLSVQSGINSTLGYRAGRSFAAVVSFTVGLGALLIFYGIEVHALGGRGPTKEGVGAVPWWGWFGGFLGAFYVAVVIIFAQTLGAATLMAIFVTAQLAMAIVLDASGWVGFRKRPLHWARLVGLVLMVGGVVLITYFGDHQQKKHADEASAAHSTTNGTAVPSSSPINLVDTNVHSLAPSAADGGSRADGAVRTPSAPSTQAGVTGRRLEGVKGGPDDADGHIAGVLVARGLDIEPGRS